MLQMSSPTRPLVVYFPDPKQWFERAVPLGRRQEFLERVEAKLDQIEGPIVLIASRLFEEERDLDDRARLVLYQSPPVIQVPAFACVFDAQLREQPSKSSISLLFILAKRLPIRGSFGYSK